MRDGFLDEVRAKRKPFAEILADEEYSGVREILEKLYPDRAHFIFELLQNAEDAGATSVDFSLEPELLRFKHNGDAFNEKDVWAITNIGKSTKEQQENKIGCFGIGFKAVFAYCETPHIWSPDYSFSISDLYVPAELKPKSGLGNETCFEFPFNNPGKSPQAAFDEIRSGLKELDETALLFLTNLKSIRWQIDEDQTEVFRKFHDEHHVEIVKQFSGTKTKRFHYLRFTNLVEGLNTQCVAIAFELALLPKVTAFDLNTPIEKQLKIASADTGQVAVYFPARKETSNLRFHLHAPFVPDLNRSSIKETPANEPLFDQIASLAASSLETIRNLGLLTGDFLAVLPNPEDELPERYRPIRHSIIEAMNEKPLTPTDPKGHAPAKLLLQSKASLKALLSAKDLAFLFKNEYDTPPQWAINASQKNSAQDKFLNGLVIRQWGVSEFTETLIKKTEPYYRNEEFAKWLAAKSDAWFQRLYSTLYENLELLQRKYYFNWRTNLKIVRLSDGRLSEGSECYFPSDGVDHDENLPRVARNVYSSGKSEKQKENALNFLKKFGVGEVGEADEIQVILDQRYHYDHQPPGKKIYQKDLERFIAFLENGAEGKDLFDESACSREIFECKDGKWVTPDEIYIDAPFEDTGLAVYYELLGDEAECFPLSNRYTQLGIDLKRIVRFAEAIGAKKELVPVETDCSDNPDFWRWLCKADGERRTSSAIDKDYTIVGLEELIEEPTMELSRLIWKTMCSLPTSPNFLQAKYRNSKSYNSHVAKSQFVHILKKASWVPQEGRGFVTPAEAKPNLLPEGFPYDFGQKWLKEVEFGSGDEKRSEAKRQQKSAASQLGITTEDAEFIQANPKAFSKLKQDTECRESNRLAREDVLSQNRDRRDKKLKERQEGAPVKESVKRVRSVPAYSKKSEVDQESLYDYNRNDDGKIVCQMCDDLMPFLKKDGKEFAECFDLFTKPWADEYDYPLKVMTPLNAVLCPVCGAIYREYIHNDTARQEALFEHLVKENEDQFSVCNSDKTTDERERSLSFSPKHLEDIQVCLESSDDPSEDDE